MRKCRSSLLPALIMFAGAGVISCSDSRPVPDASAASAAETGSADVAADGSALVAELLTDWQEQQRLMVSLADAMPADKFDYKPTPAQRTYGEQIMHVATGNVELMKLLGDAPAAPFTLESAAHVVTKREIIEALGDSYDFGSAVLRRQTPASITLMLSEDTPFFGASTRARVVWTLLSHAMDIYGQMVVYVRLNAIVPPASRGI